MNARKEASIFSGFRHGALWSAVYNIPSSCSHGFIVGKFTAVKRRKRFAHSSLS